jgi:hypothetical protein
MATADDQIAKTSEAVPDKCSTGGEMIKRIIRAQHIMTGLRELQYNRFAVGIKARACSRCRCRTLCIQLLGRETPCKKSACVFQYSAAWSQPKHGSVPRRHGSADASCCNATIVTVTATRIALLAACFLLVSCSVCCSTLETKAVCSSVLSADFHRSTWRNIPEEGTVHDFISSMMEGMRK